MYLDISQSQIFRYFGIKIYDLGHPEFIEQQFSNKKYYWSLEPKLLYDNNLINYIPYRYYSKNKSVSPINLGQVGLALLEKSSDITDYSNINKWIINNEVIKNHNNYWFIDYDVPTFKIKAPWYSGLSHGIILSYMIRFENKFNKGIFNDTINRTLRSIMNEVKNGGYSWKWKDHYIIEEYSTLPFCSRWLVKKFGTRAILGLKQLEENGNIHQFAQLVEEGKGKVSQAEHTILITPQGKIITTA